MPTGYTAGLQDLKYDVKKWLKENVVRGMGICCRLRDDGSMNESQIVKALSKGHNSEESYHQKELSKAKAELKKYQSRSQKEWDKEYAATWVKEDLAFKRRLEEWQTEKKKHEDALKEVQRIRSKAPRSGTEDNPSVAQGTLRFAEEQLIQVLDHEYTGEPYKDDVLSMTNFEWRDGMIADAERDVKYHAEQIEKENQPKKDHAKVYKEFVEFIDKA